jgi:hypothetical protein
MLSKILPVGIVAVLLVVCGGCTSSPTATTHQGKVVAVSGNTLTMTDLAGGNQHSHDVAADATITCAGATCMLTDLKAGFTVTVTVEPQGNQTVVTRIEAVEAKS